METALSHEAGPRGPLTIGIAGRDAPTALYMLRSILDGDEPYEHAGVVCSLETFDGVERRVGWDGALGESELARHSSHARAAGLEYLLVELPDEPADAAAFDILCSLEAGRCTMRDGRAVTFAEDDPAADVWASDERCSMGIVSFAAHTPGWTWRIAFPMPGSFNVTCALAAIAICVELGVEASRVVERFYYVRVPGRMELLLSPDRDVIGIIDCADDLPSCRRFFSALAEELPGYRLETVLEPAPAREDAIIRAVRDAYASGEETLVCLLGSAGSPERAQADADIFNDAVRRYSPGL